MAEYHRERTTYMVLAPHIESIHSGEDPTDIPVPDFDTDSDLVDDSFWVKWLAEIRADECVIADRFMVSNDNNQAGLTGEVPAALRPSDNDQVSPTWEPDTTIELDLHNWGVHWL